MPSTFKNAGATLTTTDSGALYTASGSGQAVVHALYITNKSVANQAFVDVKVTTDGGSTFYHLAKKVNIPPSNTLTIAGELASTSNIGVAKFTSDNFTVSSGDVSITTVDGGSF